MSTHPVQKEFDSRRFAEQMQTNIETIKETVFDKTTIETYVEVGSILWSLSDQIDAILKRIKAEIRAVALGHLDGQVGTVQLLGDDLGEVSVNFPEPILRVPRDKNIAGVQQMLGTDFKVFFDEVKTYQPAKDYEKQVAAIHDPITQRALLDAIERIEATPRVSFRRNRLSRRESL